MVRLIVASFAGRGCANIRESSPQYSVIPAEEDAPPQLSPSVAVEGQPDYRSDPLQGFGPWRAAFLSDPDRVQRRGRFMLKLAISLLLSEVISPRMGSMVW